MATIPVNTGPQFPAEPPRHILYVPGYRAGKLALAALGLVLLAIALAQMTPLVRLVMVGGSARAEAVMIIRTDSAGEASYTADADVLSAVKKVEETWDRDSVFWVVYRFKTPDGKEIETRAPMGQHKKPIQMLRDTDGLPSTIQVWYPQNEPSRIVFPWMLGTWFMPGMLALFGFLGTFMGLMLWWHANKPIEMPDLSHSHGELADVDEKGDAVV